MQNGQWLRVEPVLMRIGFSDKVDKKEGI